ncbi:cupin domain-containing protein [Paenibacillus rigui]|uniref:Cupin type-1 domain-containing protein n=1 Tax=Paenibacillus rigui TaxID=554312 RepID=A0A229UQG1_9BACL|nr:cupin domain-containing protein [Paenibacillus rigui]OXM85620.1 hypothetical protein CF651_14640 [Paenibacillus rigui]
MMSNTMNPTGKQSMEAPNLFYDLKQNDVQSGDPPSPRSQQVTAAQLPILQGVSLTRLHMTRAYVQSPHWHPNAGELAYVISGEVTISVLDPLTSRRLTYQVKPDQGVFLPTGWWHWITCSSEEAHLLMIYNHDSPISAQSTDALRLTPSDVLQQAYRMNRNRNEWAESGQSITETNAPVPAADRVFALNEHRRSERPSVIPTEAMQQRQPASSYASAAQATAGKRQAVPPKKATSIRNSSSSSPTAAAPEPAVWRPAVPGLQVRIGSMIHNS